MDTLIQNGKTAPVFTLNDLNGAPHRLSSYLGRVVVVYFWSAECPHVARSDQLLMNSIEHWGNRVQLLPVAANANEPIPLLRQVAEERNLPLVLHDPEHAVADLYGALTTPHCFVLDPQGNLRYQGAFDDVTFRQRTPTRAFLLNAVQAVLDGRNFAPAVTPPYGCTIVRFSPE